MRKMSKSPVCTAPTCAFVRVSSQTLNTFFQISPRLQPTITKYSRLSSIMCVGSTENQLWSAAQQQQQYNLMISCRPSLPRRPHLSSTLANAVHRNAQLQSSPSAASEISVTPSKSHQLAVTDKIRCLLGPELFTICTKRDFENSPRTKLELRTRVENESRMNSSSTPCGLSSYSMGFK